MLDYNQNYKPELKSKNISFFVNNRNENIAIVPLFIEKKSSNGKKIHEFSFGGGPLPVPALKNNLDKKTSLKIQNFIFEYIDYLAKKHNIAKISYKFTPISPSFINSIKLPYNYLTRYSFIDVSSSTRLIDLKKDKETLWGELRRNHRRAIKKVKDRFDIEIYNKKTINKTVFDEYRLTHKKAAGRITRPLITFKKMYQWIKNGYGILVVSRDKKNNKNVGFELYCVYKNNVYGASAANDPKYLDLPIRHLIEWEAILYLKKNNCKYYEIGPEYVGPNLHYFPSKKEVNISFFKEGFGGFSIPFFMGEKYYSSEYFDYEMKNRINEFIRKNNWNIQTNIEQKNLLKKPKREKKEIEFTDKELEKFIKKILIENKKVINDFLEGKKTVTNFIVGKVKREFGGKVKKSDYKKIIEIFKKEIEKYR